MARSALGRSENLRELFKLFIAPIIGQFNVDQATDEELMAKLEMFFAIKHRDIVLCKATRDFKLRGPKWATKSTPHKLIPGSPEDYQVKKGDALWVRFDDRTPNHVEVETDRACFRIDTSDWNVYSGWVEELC
jgi:hypothetical protein